MVLLSGYSQYANTYYYIIISIDRRHNTMKEEPKKIFNHPDWEIYRPKRITWVGFLVAWGFVLALMLATWFIARIGA